MSVTASTSEEATFRSFVDLLKLGKVAPAIPDETARQAVSHFLATRPNEDLVELLDAAIPANIWGDAAEGSGRTLEDCFRDAVQLKLLQARLTTGWRLSWAALKADRGGTWLQAVIRGVPSQQILGQRGLHVKLGILQGLRRSEGLSRQLVRVQEALEDQVVLELADRLQSGSGSLSAYQLSAPLLALPSWKTHVLVDFATRKILADALYEDSLSAEQVRIVNSALQHSFQKSLSVQSRKGKERAWADMGQFASDMHQRCSATADETRRRQHLDTLLVVGPSIIEEITCHQPESNLGGSTYPSDIAVHLLLAVACCQRLESQGAPLETEAGYQELLYGCLDVVVAKCSEPQIVDCIQQVEAAVSRGSSAAFSVLVMEQFVSMVSRQTLRDRFWPACQRHLPYDGDQKSNEAAHSLVLAMLASPQLLQDVSSQAWAGELVRWYGPLIVQDVVAGHLTADQASAAFKALGHTASAVEPGLLQGLVWQMDNQLKTPVSRTQKQASTQTLRLCLVALLPYTPVKQLRRMLYNDIRPIILNLPAGSADRTDLCQALYDEIGTGLGDQAKLVGYNFWLEERSQLVGERDDKARL